MKIKNGALPIKMAVIIKGEIMKKIILTSLVSILVCTSANAKMAIKSNDVANGKTLKQEQVFNGFGCSGANISPQISWSGAPKDTKSFALTVYDPDAPTGSGWWHWVVFNIPKETNQLPLNYGANNANDGAIQSRTDFGTYGFGGACPPQGDKPHRYIFTIHALKTDKIPLDKDASAAMVGFMLNANTIEKVSIIAKYGR